MVDCSFFNPFNTVINFLENIITDVQHRCTRRMLVGTRVKDITLIDMKNIERSVYEE